MTRTLAPAAAAILAAILFLPSSASATAADTTSAYVGVDRCKMCHMAQFRHWQTVSMSRAYERVRESEDVGKFVQCHSTGFGRPGGFTTIEATPHLAGVQCEACHGPGREHVSMPVSNRDPAARRATINRNRQDCASCHESDEPHETPRTPQTRPERFHVAPDTGSAPATRPAARGS